jgi:tRNA threonylcarbamoyladenosine biosynthesis protein TsaB
MNTKSLNMLAIDTSSADLILGMQFAGDRLVQSRERIERSHGQFIMKKIGELLQSASLTPGDIGAVTVCTGPGSFTGLRIGLAAAKGIAVVNQIPVIGVSLFELAAYLLGNENPEIWLLAPARKGEYFAVKSTGGTVDLEAATAVMTRDLPQLVGNLPAAGFGDTIAADLQVTGLTDMSSHLKYDAAHLLILGLTKYEQGLIPDLNKLEPLYLRRSQAELRWAERHGKDPQS